MSEAWIKRLRAVEEIQRDYDGPAVCLWPLLCDVVEAAQIVDGHYLRHSKGATPWPEIRVALAALRAEVERDA